MEMSYYKMTFDIWVIHSQWHSQINRDIRECNMSFTDMYIVQTENKKNLDLEQPSFLLKFPIQKEFNHANDSIAKIYQFDVEELKVFFVQLHTNNGK